MVNAYFILQLNLLAEIFNIMIMKRLSLLVSLFLFSFMLKGQEMQNTNQMQCYQCFNQERLQLIPVDSTIFPIVGTKLVVTSSEGSLRLDKGKAKGIVEVVSDTVNKLELKINGTLKGKQKIIVYQELPSSKPFVLFIKPKKADIKDFPIKWSLNDSAFEEIPQGDDVVVASIGDTCTISVEAGDLFPGNEAVGRKFSTTENTTVKYSVYGVNRQLRVEFLSDEDLVKKVRENQHHGYANHLANMYLDLKSKYSDLDKMYNTLEEKVEVESKLNSTGVDVFEPIESHRESKKLNDALIKQNDTIPSANIWDLDKVPDMVKEKLKWVNDVICQKTKLNCIQTYVESCEEEEATSTIKQDPKDFKEKLFSNIETKIYEIDDSLKAIKKEKGMFSNQQYEYIDELHKALGELYKTYSIYED